MYFVQHSSPWPISYQFHILSPSKKWNTNTIQFTSLTIHEGKGQNRGHIKVVRLLREEDRARWAPASPRAPSPGPPAVATSTASSPTSPTSSTPSSSGTRERPTMTAGKRRRPRPRRNIPSLWPRRQAEMRTRAPTGAAFQTATATKVTLAKVRFW